MEQTLLRMTLLDTGNEPPETLKECQFLKGVVTNNSTGIDVLLCQ
jgi:hypothetical protein